MLHTGLVLKFLLYFIPDWVVGKIHTPAHYQQQGRLTLNYVVSQYSRI